MRNTSLTIFFCITIILFLCTAIPSVVELITNYIDTSGSLIQFLFPYHAIYQHISLYYVYKNLIYLICNSFLIFNLIKFFFFNCYIYIFLILPNRAYFVNHVVLIIVNTYIFTKLSIKKKKPLINRRSRCYIGFKRKRYYNRSARTYTR